MRGGDAGMKLYRPLRTTQLYRELVNNGEDGAYRQLLKCANYIDSLGQFSPLDWEISPNTRLRKADSALKSYKASAKVLSALSSSQDHLATIKALLFDASAQHTYSPFTIIRGSLEATAGGLYAIGRRNIKSIIERSLSLEYSDITNASKMYELWDLPHKLEDVRPRLEEIAQANGIATSRVAAHLPYTKIIKTVDEEYKCDSIMYGIWQLTSGIAHNKSWAALALTDMKEIPGTRNNIGARYSLTSNTTWLARSVLFTCIYHEILRRTYFQATSGEALSRDAIHIHAARMVLNVDD